MDSFKNVVGNSYANIKKCVCFHAWHTTLEGDVTGICKGGCLELR